MHTPEEIKLVVRQKYGDIAEQSRETNASGCCGAGASSCCAPELTVMADDYSHVEGHVADADLALGCGLPTAFADLRPGMTVLDLGSGAGNDVFVAAHAVGTAGRVIGVDMTPAMIAKAEENARRVGATNVEFRLGEIEALPVDDASVDVVISNCVLNLVPDKARAFAEIARVLRPGGWFTVSDIVIDGTLPPALQSVAELYVGCVAGASARADYLAHVTDAGFVGTAVLTEKEIIIPPELFAKLTASLPAEERNPGEARILSVTVRAEKPA